MLIDTWNKNKDSENSNSESFWQDELTSNPEILGRILGGKVIFLGEKVNIGTSGLDGKGTKIADFAYEHEDTKNLTLIEIKTPDTKLLGRFYGRGAYPLSSDTSESIAQSLIQRNDIMKSFHQKKMTLRVILKFIVLNAL